MNVAPVVFGCQGFTSHLELVPEYSSIDEGFQKVSRASGRILNRQKYLQMLPQGAQDLRKRHLKLTVFIFSVNFCFYRD